VTGFLTALYQDVLNRAIEPAALQSWSTVMAHGVARWQVAAAVLGSVESDKDEVQSYYLRFLHRPADTSGLNAFVNALQNGMRNEDVITILIGSGEYYNNTPK
jgi:hypothetical protein